jgi:hypothetical protein
VRRNADLPVDVEDAAVGADVNRLTRRKTARRENPIGSRHLFRRIAQDRIVATERLRVAKGGLDDAAVAEFILEVRHELEKEYPAGLSEH